MKYLLIMQLIFIGSQNGGATIETVEFERLDQCYKAQNAFMVDMKDDRPYGRIYRKAMCIQIED